MRASSLPSDTLHITDSMLLREVVVQVAKYPVELRGDTLIYDVASFRVREGSRLRELLKLLPGIEVTSEGVVKAQGKVVSRILLNGNEFFDRNKEIALDNLTAEILTQVKVYDRSNPDDETLGLRGDNVERVLDVTTKEDKDNGWFCDVSASGGSENRYTGTVALTQFNDVWQNMISADADNLPRSMEPNSSYYDRLTRHPSTNDTHKQNYNAILYHTQGKWELSGMAAYDSQRGKGGQRSIFESYLQDERTYTVNRSDNNNHVHSFNSNFSLRWSDSLTQIFIGPSIVFDKVRYRQIYRSGLYDVRPHNWDLFTGSDLGEYEHLVNSNMNASQDDSKTYSVGLTARVTRRLNKRGTALLVEARAEYEHSEGNSFSVNNVIYFRRPERMFQTRYQDNPRSNHITEVRFKLVQPLVDELKFVGEYNLLYRKQSMDQTTFNLDKSLNSPLGASMPVASPQTYCDSLSKYATNTSWGHRAKLMLQYAYEGFNASVGVQINPDYTVTRYRRARVIVDTSRTVLNWSPEFVFYYRKNDKWNLTLQYSGTSRRPDLFQLLPIPDDTDPLNSRIGNPKLKPAFVHSMNASFFFFNADKQQQVNLTASAYVDQNAFAESVVYNTQTGRRNFMPVNINGNRSFSGSWTLGSALGFVPNWYVECTGEVTHLRMVGLQQLVRNVDDSGENPETRYVTKRLGMTNYLSLQWSHSLGSVQPYGYMSYDAANSTVSGAVKRKAWTFGYGVLGRLDLDCGLSAVVDVYNHSRRGYIGQEMNRDEFICDAELSYSFLKGRSATVRLQGCDLFRNRLYMSGDVGVQGRKETTYIHAVGSYVLATFSYRFSLFGSSKSGRKHVSSANS